MSKKFILLASSVLLLGVVSNTSADLVAHWALDGDATDSVAGHHGTLVGGAEFVEDAKRGSVLSVDGISGRVEVPHADDIGFIGDTTLSVSVWVKPALLPRTSWTTVLAKNRDIHYNNAYGIWISTSNMWHFRVGGTAGDGSAAAEEGWHHLAMTHDPSTSTLRGYLDGQMVYENTAAAPGTIGNSSLWIGGAGGVSEYYPGLIDDVKIFNHALSSAEVSEMIPPQLTAYEPDPPDGAENVTDLLFQWRPGDTAVFHNVYLGTNPDLGPADLVTIPNYQYAMYWHLPGFIAGATYYWRVDEVEVDGTTTHTGDVWSFTAAPLSAYNPDPPDGARYVSTDVVLSWEAGFTAVTHDVYFGTDEIAVADGAGGTFKGNRPETTYDPGTLAKDTRYYWRIDEVELNKTTKYRGDVWSFKTIPQIDNVPRLVGWWKLDEGEGTICLDWSGHDHHGSLLNGPQWVVGYDGGALEFDGVDDHVEAPHSSDLAFDASASYTVMAWVNVTTLSGSWAGIVTKGRDTGDWYGIWVNPSNEWVFGHDGDNLSGSGATAGDWHHLAAVYDNGSKELYLDGALDIQTSVSMSGDNGGRVWIGGAASVDEYLPGKVDDARVYNEALTQAEIWQAMRGDPRLAWGPSPANRSITDVEKAVPLAWSPGDMAVKHDVYFGTDEDAVEDADTTTTGIHRGRQDPNTYIPSEGVEFGQSYYWRIDEFNTDASVSTGKIWSFTVADYLIMDDFEPYDDFCRRVFYAWPDGWGHSGDVSCGVTPYGGNGTGSTVGYLQEPYAEQTIVHEGDQSMPMEYLNDGSTGKALYSETERTFDPAQDWTRHGVKALTLWFRGLPGSVGSFSYDPITDIYTMTADGQDIWNTQQPPGSGNWVEHDEFHYAYKQLSSNGSIEAQVLSVANTDGWAKAGVMIRETLDANSVHAMVVMTPANGVSFQRRPTVGGASEHTTLAGFQAPRWVRLTRSANNFTAEHSADGATWETVGTQSIPMAASVYIGLALTSHNNDPTVACTGTFSDVTTTGTITGQWQSQDIGIASNDAEQLYVAVEDSSGKRRVANHPDPNAVLSDTWQEWNIALTAFSSDAGVNIQSVKKVCVGVGDRAAPKLAAGTLYIDDIRLYRSRCLPSLMKLDADFSGNCIVDYADLDIMANEWLVDANNLQADLNLDSEVDFEDYAELADTWLDVLLWP